MDVPLQHNRTIRDVFRAEALKLRYPNGMARRSLIHDRQIGLHAWSAPSKGPMAVAHAHHDLEFNFVLHGSMTYLVSGSIITVPSHRLAVLWGAMPHQTVAIAADTRLIWVCVPLAQVLSWRLPESFMSRLLTTGAVLDVEDRPTDRALLEQWITDLQPRDEARAALVLREIESRLHRLALDLAPVHSRPRSSRRRRDTHATGPAPTGAFLTVHRMAQFIAEHFAEPISAGDIAAAAGLHPNYAMTLFRRQTGLTINQFLTRQRIAHAQRLLATTSLPILDVGYDSGFGSASRFFQAFKQIAGLSPRQFRARVTRTGGPT